MKFILQLLLSFLLLGSSSLLLAKDDKEISKSYRKEAKRFRFRVKTQVKFPAQIRGSVLPVSAVEEELERFFQALNELGEGFVRKSGLKYVVICNNLTLNGMRCAGVAAGDTIYMAKGFSKRTVYHEMFHIFDPKRENKKWQRLNQRKFRYRGIDFPDRPISKKKKKDLQEHYSKHTQDFSRDFVTRYAQSNEVEDRAETFACMIDEGRRFKQRCNKSKVLFNKMLFIVDMTDRSSLLGKDYWCNKLGMDSFPKAQKSGD